MPYVSEEERDSLRPHSHEVAGTPGALNYQLTILCLRYLGLHGLSYQHLNDVIGALECAKQEMYRRVAAPYEDNKAAVNGDVYP